MTDTNWVKPRLDVLTDGQMTFVHEQSLQILGSAGVRVDSERAQALFAQKVGRAAVRDGRVYLPREIVEWALSCAPNAIDIYDRLGRPAFRWGEDRTRFGIGVTNLYYQEPETDAVTPFAREHMAICVRLGNALPHYDAISTIGVIQDMPQSVADLYAALEMIANTTKPLIILVSETGLFPRVCDLLAHLAGDLAAKPFVIPYFNPVTPLIINRETVEKMFAAIDRGLPIIYSNYGMAGTSTPITPAGILALLNAELLAGLALSQLYKEGTPVVLGSLPAFFDMREMVDFFDPHSALLNLACAEMMAHYGLPHAGLAGTGNGWGPDLPQMGMLWLSNLVSCLGKVGMVPFVGGTLGSKAFSPTVAVCVHDVIGQALHLAEGFPLDEESIALDDIARVGPGGNFLASKLTRARFREVTYQNPLFPNLSLEKWQSLGHPKAIDRLREHTRHLIDTAAPPDDHDEMMARGEAYITRFCSGAARRQQD
jgi:trimethylamine--corrinoid protein Co-methyltransferase